MNMGIEYNPYKLKVGICSINWTRYPSNVRIEKKGHCSKTKHNTP
jgi:hypothetical protein